VNSLQRQRSPTRPARSGTPAATPVSTTATVRPAPLAPPWWAWTTLAPGRGWRCQQASGSQASTRRTQSGSAYATPGRPASRRAAARTSASRSSSTTRVRPFPATTRPSTATAAARRPPPRHRPRTRPAPARARTPPPPARMGPLTGRVAEPGGGVLRLSTAPAGAGTGAAGSPAAAAGTQASATARSRTRASEGRPAGKPMGCPCSRRGPILMTGSAGTRRSLPRRGRDPGEPRRQ
jgi:hypothetical protein